MAKASAAVLKFEIDDDQGAAQDLTAFIDDIGEHGKSEEVEETTPFGTDFRTYRGVEVQGMDSFSIAGFYDDSDPGPDATIGDDGVGDTREVTITYKSGESRTFNVIVQAFNVIPQRNNLTRWSATLQPTGFVTGVS